MAPRRRCPTCGSRQWHKEPSSGLIACSEGHVLQNYRSETTEITEVGPHAMKKRTLKSRRKKKESTSKADPKLYYGARSRYHYFLCLQLILRKQVAALIKLWDCPPEFEVLCRDIWALHLSLLPDAPPAEPYYYAQETREAGEDLGEVKERPALDPMKVKVDPSTPREADDNASEGSSTEDEAKGEDDQEGSDEDGEDSELEAMMRENSEISSSSSSEGENLSTPMERKSKKGKRNGQSTYESPVSTIAILVVACWTLRIPVMLKDLTSLIDSYELPYLDPTLRVLPASMVQHLTKQKVQALSPRHAPLPLAIHSVASRLAKKLYATYGVYTPECNAASLLWRLTRAMAGTPTVYQLAKRTASVLSIPLTLHSSLSPEPERAEQLDKVRHQYDNAPPEVALVACIIIVLKMVYGLDGQKRTPKDGGDVACAMPDSEEYLAEIKKLGEEDLEKKETRFGAKSNLRVGDMDAKELDRYMKFCELALLGPNKEEDGVLDRYFPTTRKEREGEEERPAAEAEESIREMRGCRPGDGLRPGGEYKMWNARDVDGTAAKEYVEVLGRGASVTGVTEEYLGGIVFKYEGRLVADRKRRQRRRRE